MYEAVTDVDGDDVVVEAGATTAALDGHVRLLTAEPALLLTAQSARKLAGVLLRAADESELGADESGVRQELAAVNDALRAAGINYPLGARGVAELAARTLV